MTCSQGQQWLKQSQAFRSSDLQRNEGQVDCTSDLWALRHIISEVGGLWTAETWQNQLHIISEPEKKSLTWLFSDSTFDRAIFLYQHVIYIHFKQKPYSL